MATKMTLDGTTLLNTTAETKAAPTTTPPAVQTPVWTPFTQAFAYAGERKGLVGSILSASAAFGIAATIITVGITRRKTAPKRRSFFGKPMRHFGYGRYQFGSLGTAYLAYTYKLPKAPYHLKQATYRIPAIQVKLPTLSR